MNQIQGEYADAIAALWLLVERYPACFFMLERKRRPLQIGIRDLIIAAGTIEPDQFNLALQFYCRSTSYLVATARGGARIGLDGQPAGEITPEQQAGAAKAVAAHWARQAARKAAARQAEAPMSALPPLCERCGRGHDIGNPCHAPTAPIPEVPAGPKRRLGLADLRQLAQVRKQAAAQ
jgi:sRNA-binding protein